MGCTYNVPILKRTKVDSPVGLLSIQIDKIFIDDKNPLFKTQKNGLLLSISNNEFQIKSSLVNDCNKNQQKITFTCFINSFYKQFGRIMLATLYNQQIDIKFNQQTRAFGIIDLNPFIFFKNTNKQQKCHINFSKTSIGYLNLKIKFKQLNYYKLKFIVKQFIQEKNLLIKKIYFCKVTAGQEILQTQITQHNHNINYTQSILEFYIPEGLNSLNIQIIQKNQTQNDILIGQGVFDLFKIIKVNKGTQLKIPIKDSILNIIGHVHFRLLEDGIDQQFFLYKKVIQSMRVIQTKSDKQKVTQASINHIITHKRLPPIKGKLSMTSLDSQDKIEQKSSAGKQTNSNPLIREDVSIKLIPEQQEQCLSKQIELQPTDFIIASTKQNEKLNVRIPCLQVEI